VLALDDLYKQYHDRLKFSKIASSSFLYRCAWNEMFAFALTLFLKDENLKGWGGMKFPCF